MKKLLPILLLIAGCSRKVTPEKSVYSQLMGRAEMSVSDIVISKDTSIYGDWIITPKNRIVRFEASGHIHGNGKMWNGVIKAGLYQHIFDTSFKVNPYGTYDGVFPTTWYGANPDNKDNYGALQTSIDCVIRNAGRLMKCFTPQGFYNYSKQLEIKNIYKGQYVGATIDFYGESSISDAGTMQGTTLKYNSSIGYGLGLQMMKGGAIHNLTLQGTFKVPVLSDTAFFNTSFDNYKDANGICGENYAGLVVDFDGTKNLGGSSFVHFYDLHVKNFTIDYSISPNGRTFNADALTFDRIRGGDCKTVFATGQGQEKGNKVNGLFMWDNCHTLIAIGLYGKMQSGNYTFDGGNVAGRPIRLSYVQQGNWNSSIIKNFFFENFGTLGMFISNVPLTFENNTFNFAPQSVAGKRSLFYSNNVAVKFKGCTFQSNNGLKEDLPFAAIATFDGCYFWGTPVNSMSGAVFRN